MDFEVKDVDEAKEETSTQGAWDQFRSIPQTLAELDDDEAIVKNEMQENTVKSLRSFLNYYMEEDEYKMRQRKQLDGTITVVIEKG